MDAPPNTPYQWNPVHLVVRSLTVRAYFSPDNTTVETVDYLRMDKRLSFFLMKYCASFFNDSMPSEPL